MHPDENTPISTFPVTPSVGLASLQPQAAPIPSKLTLDTGIGSARTSHSESTAEYQPLLSPIPATPVSIMSDLSPPLSPLSDSTISLHEAPLENVDADSEPAAFLTANQGWL